MSTITTPPDEGAYIRRTYAHFARVGVAHDGVDDGAEHTRHRHAPPQWDADAPSRVLDAEALARDLQRHETLDRYGFYDARPAHAHAEPLVLARSALCLLYTSPSPRDS